MSRISAIGLWVQILRVPYGVLFPLILLVCVIGVYGVSQNVWDIVIMLGFGVAGYLMRKTGYEPARSCWPSSWAGSRRNPSASR